MTKKKTATGGTMSVATPRIPVVFSEGFRTFFLVGPLFAILAMVVWMMWLGIHAAGAVLLYTPFAVPPHQWHAHEMIYGYGGAVLAGFFLTAVPNWTGAPPSKAPFILGLASLWLLGRISVFVSSELPAVLVMVIDVAFIPVLGAKTLSNLLKRFKPQNAILLGLIALTTAGNVQMHLDWIGVMPGQAGEGARTGLLTLAAMICVIGGRVTPAFTRNALTKNDAAARLPVHRAPFDAAGIASAIALATLAPFAVDGRIIAGLASVAAVANAGRLAGWRTVAILDKPILWSLHLGFALLAAGYAALAWHGFGGPIGETAALHVLGIGAVGGMTVAVMSRAALGHTGRPLEVEPPIALAYGLIAAATMVRALGSVFLPSLYFSVMFVAGALWIAAFLLFIVAYLPILTAPRVDDRS